MRIALIESKPSRNKFFELFQNKFNFESFVLCSNPQVKKVLKRDVDIQFNPDDYDWVILVGSEPLKYYTKATSITEYSGRIVEDKFLPVINPAMLAFKPEAKKTWEESRDNIVKYIHGELKQETLSKDEIFGITDSKDLYVFLDDALNHDNDFIALDSETTSLYPRDGHMIGISLSYKKNHGAYISTDCIDEKAEKLLQQLFDKKKVVFHNSKFDIAFFKFHFGFNFPRFEDTMLMHYTLNEQPGTHGLKQLALKFTPFGDYEKPMYDWIEDFRKRNGLLKDDFSWDMIPFDIMKDYAAYDAVCTFLIYQEFLPYMQKNKKLGNVYYNILLPATEFLLDVESNGVPFDKDRLMKSTVLMQEEIDKAVADLYNYKEVEMFEKQQGKDFNPNSTVQLRSLLFDFIGLKPTGKKTGTGADSTDAEVLGKLAEEHAVPQLILDIRQKVKIKNTYLDKILPALDRDDLKGCIRAKEGKKIVAMDLTTAEVYCAAVLAEDTALQQVFKDGGNFHSNIAKLVFNLPCEVDDVAKYYSTERQMAKAVTFGIMYGAGPKKISEQVTKDSGKYFSTSEAKEVIEDYFRQFHKLKKWLDDCKKLIEKQAYIYSFFGRKRRLTNVKSTDRAIAAHEVRSGINSLVQSVASDVNLLGAIDANKEVDSSKAKIFALVHDSILAEVDESYVDEYCEILKRNVQRDRGLSISGCPIGCDFDIGEDYSFGKFKEKYETTATNSNYIS
jgi:DNA polymerase I-like protein with 3'-5' exonuclease and polymerase domains